jgi:hypothetical protein
MKPQNKDEILKEMIKYYGSLDLTKEFEDKYKSKLQAGECQQWEYDEYRLTKVIEKVLSSSDDYWIKQLVKERGEFLGKLMSKDMELKDNDKKWKEKIKDKITNTKLVQEGYKETLITSLLDDKTDAYTTEKRFKIE